MQYYLLSVITPTDLMPDEPQATGMLALCCSWSPASPRGRTPTVCSYGAVCA